MQRTQKTGANEKWKPLPISTPTTRIRAACKIPPWMAKGSSTNLSIPPPVPTEPPPMDPDYEVIEFPSQQYTNTAPIRFSDKRHASQGGNSGQQNNHRCDLCGSSAPCVRCEKCNNQTFCISCDDMYHRHPKRQNHVRRAMDSRNQVLPPLPPKGETFVPPVPPPRRHKKSSRMTTPTPEEQNRHFKKEGSIIGSLKRFIGGRPLPPTPQTLRDPRFMHSSTLPLSTVDLNDQPSSRDSGYLDWESDLKHRSGSLTALNNSCFSPLMQAQSMAQLNCPSCHQHGMMWDWGNRVNHLNSRTMNPWASPPTGTWHGSQILPSNYRRQNISPFEDSFWRRPGVPYPPSRSSTRSKRDLNSLDGYEDDIASKMNDSKSIMFRGSSPAMSRRNYASSDSDDETASKRSGSRQRKKNLTRQSRDVSPALSRRSVRQNNKMQDEVFLNRGNRRFRKSTASRNVSPVRSRKNSCREFSDSDENNAPTASDHKTSRIPSPALSTRSRKSSKSKLVTKQEYNPKSSIESIKDSSSSDQNPNENENIPFVPTVDWECQHCTFVNKAGSRICAVCCKTTSALRIKNKSMEQEELPVEKEKLNQSIEDLNINDVSSTPSKLTIHKAENKLNNYSIKSNNVESINKQRGKVLTSSSSVDVNFEKAVISTGTSPPPQSISTQTYDVGGGKLRRAASVADQDLWKPPPRSISRQSILSDSPQSLPMTPARTPDIDETLINFEPQQPSKNTLPFGRRSFDAVSQNVIRPSARRAGSQPPEYLSTMVQKQVKQGLEMVKLLREAEQHHFSADDLSVALTHCGENDPVAWLLDNWQNMIDTVVTLATNYGHERKENTIGTISAAEARDALRVHNGNVWKAVDECVDQRQKKYAELLSRGNFSREDIVTVLTANHGDLDLASRELSKSQLKPFLMRIWGPAQGVDNDCGDTSKLFRNDSFEHAEPGIEIDNVKELDEVSVRDNFKINQMKIPSNESTKNKMQSIDFDEMSMSDEQLKILECTEALKNIRSSVYDNDIISASLKLGLQNILRQDKSLSDHISSLKSTLKSETFSNSQGFDEYYHDSSTYSQSPTDRGQFDPPSSFSDRAGDCLASHSRSSNNRNGSNDRRPSWIRKRGFSHAMKSNFQPYRTVSVCDLSDSVLDSTQSLSNSQSNNQINLSTVYYNDSANNLQKNQHRNSSTVSNLNYENRERREPIPQLYMEVTHELHNFDGRDPDDKGDKEKGSLENEGTKDKHTKVDQPSETHHEMKEAEISDSEIFYETFSVICDNSESIAADQNNSPLQTDSKTESTNTYNVQFEKDLVFVASDVDTTEQRIFKSKPSALSEKSELFLRDELGLSKNDQNSGRKSSESQNEASYFEESEKSRSISEDSSKDYQSVEEYIPREPSIKLKANLGHKTEPLSLNRPKQKSLVRSSQKNAILTPTVSHYSDKKDEQNSKEQETKQKLLNPLIKSKKKPKRPVQRKTERKLSLNSFSSKLTSQTSNKISKVSSLTNRKQLNAVPANVSSKIKPTPGILGAAKDSSAVSSKEVPSNVNLESLTQTHIENDEEVNDTELKDEESSVDLKPSTSSEKITTVNDVEASSLVDDCSTDSENKVDQTIVHTEILQVESADVDCDDANPNILEIINNENIVSDINSFGLSPQNYEPNSSDSTMKNIISISDDSSCDSNTNANNSKLDDVLEAISTSTQRPLSTDTHAGVESSNLDEGNESVNSQNLSMIENRAEILKILKESLSDDHILKGIVHTLFSSIVGSDQNEAKTSSVDIKDARQEEPKIDSKESSIDTVTELLTTDSEKISDQDPSKLERKDVAIIKSSEELTFQRKARRYLAEGVVSNFEQAKMIVHLLELNFDKALSIAAAKECSNLETAISFLQQECLLCAEKYSVNQMVSMLSCQHLCCQECALQYFTLQITERSINDCVCPFCKEPNLTTQNPDYIMNYFSNLDILLKSFLHPEVHELFQRKLRDRTLMQDPNFKWCAECSFGFIADLRQKRLTCPDCKTVSCALCDRRWVKEHEGKTCKEYDDWLEANDPGSMLAKHLVNEGVTCPACNSKYVLVKGGCMHLTCPQCKHEFCSDCSNTFLMGSNCNVSPFCEKLGLHAHHPRNCLFYLRDKEPEKLEGLLEANNVDFDKTEKENKKCNVQLQRETSDGFVDGLCNFHVFQAGLCRTHYIEYLVTLISRHKLDPIVIFDLNEVQQELRRHGKVLPTRASNAKDEDYLNLCVKMVKEEIPLE